MLVIRKNKYEELEKLRRKSNVVRLVEGMLIGATIGLLVGLLFAPKEGEETRGMITSKANGWKEKCKCMLWKPYCHCEDTLEEETE